MEIKWQDIDRALDEIITHEEGVRFQRLAISLAKQRWPDVIATEVKKDGGEDALTHPFFIKDGKRFDIASSITATWDKVKKDLKRIHERGIRIDLLIFLTARKVQNITVDDWTSRTKNEFDCELLVISREDIIHQLLAPQSQWICSTFLGFQIPATSKVLDITDKTIHAASKIIEHWKSRARFKPDQLIDIDAIQLNKKRKLTGQIHKHQDICENLAGGGRLILMGAPGAGKTTTLIQISEQLIGQKYNKVPLLFSLPEWIESGEGILDFALKHPNLIAIGINLNDLVLLHQSGRLVFVLNGWNEIPINMFSKAVHKLISLDRDFPAAGIIIATREYVIRPPFAEALELRLISINDAQRRSFVRAMLSDRADELLSQIEQDRALSEITRTPLILSEITKIYESESDIPRTKIKILQHVIRRAEESDEHAVYLQLEPVCGRASKYLSEIASFMTQKGRTSLHVDQAQSVINDVNANLKLKGQLFSSLDPKIILDTLCAHHFLDKIVYPVPSIHFIHQQFQEVFAVDKLYNKINLILNIQDENAIKQFQEKFINVPAWEESLKLLAEEINVKISKKDKMGIHKLDPLQIGNNLIEWSIAVDPILAAELVRIGGSEIWNKVKTKFGTVLREWYSFPDDKHKECAIAAMFAIGTGEFEDIIFPLINHPDQQVRLKWYRVPKEFHPSCFGPIWQNRVKSWQKERRKEFIQELSFKGGSEKFDVIEDFANKDPSTEVRIAAINGLRWYGAIDKFWKILSRCEDEMVSEVLIEDRLPERIPEDLLPRIKMTYRKILSESKHLNTKIKILLNMSNLDMKASVNSLKSEFAKRSSDEIKTCNEYYLQDAIRTIASDDPNWVSEWVSRRQAEGILLRQDWFAYVHFVPEELVEELIEKLLDPEYPENDAQKLFFLIAKGASKKHIQHVLQKLLRLQRHFDTSKNRREKVQRNFYWRLRKFTRELPWPILMEAILEEFIDPHNISELRVILDLLGSDDIEKSTVVQGIEQRNLELFRSRLRNYKEIILAEHDYSGSLKAYLSTAIFLFGEESDICLINELIQADIERIKKGEKAFQKGLHHGPQVDGFRTRWSHWHVRALCNVAPDIADDFLFPLLKVPYYEREAAQGLFSLLKHDTLSEAKFGHYFYHDESLKNYKIDSELRIDERRQKLYTTAIVEHIKNLKSEFEKSDKQENLKYRLKNLSAILSKFNDPDAVPLILEVMALPGEWDGWTCVDALEALIRNGFELDTKTVEVLLDPTITHLIERGLHDNQNRYLLRRCLMVFVFTTDDTRAFRRIKQIASKYFHAYEMRDIIIMLGQRRSREAAKYLIELAEEPQIIKKFGHKLFTAIKRCSTSDSKLALVSTIDPKVTKPKIQPPFDYHTKQILSEAIADLCKEDSQINSRIFELCSEELTNSQRDLTAQIINKISTVDAIVAGLNLISNKFRFPVPYPLREAIENALFERVPGVAYPGAYELEPREDRGICERLFDMAINDEARRRGALELLGFIYQLRIEYGRPATEPRHPSFRSNKPWPPLEIMTEIGKENRGCP